MYTGQHRRQQGVAEVFRDWLPVVVVLLEAVVTTEVGEAVVGAEAAVVDSTAGQGTNTKTE